MPFYILCHFGRFKLLNFNQLRIFNFMQIFLAVAMPKLRYFDCCCIQRNFFPYPYC